MIFRGGGAVDQNVRLACGKLGVRIPVATDLRLKTGTTANCSATGVSITSPQRWPF